MNDWIDSLTPDDFAQHAELVKDILAPCRGALAVDPPAAVQLSGREYENLMEALENWGSAERSR